MDSVLGRKQRIKNSDWIEIFDKIEQLITKKELDQLVDKTIQDIKAKTKGKKAAYAWSGGKDSLVLGEICRRAGISSCVLVISNLEYKAFTQWVEDNKPPELSIINTGQDIKWLVTHPHMLFHRIANMQLNGSILFNIEDRQNITKKTTSICSFLEDEGLMGIMLER